MDHRFDETNRIRLGILDMFGLSYKVRREQAVGTEDVKVMAMNFYKYREGLECNV